MSKNVIQLFGYKNATESQLLLSELKLAVKLMKAHTSAETLQFDAGIMSRDIVRRCDCDVDLLKKELITRFQAQG